MRKFFQPKGKPIQARGKPDQRKGKDFPWISFREFSLFNGLAPNPNKKFFFAASPRRSLLSDHRASIWRPGSKLARILIFAKNLFATISTT